MLIYIGADHRGYNLKEYLKGVLQGMGYSVIDVGDDHYNEEDDYVDYATAVAEKVSVAFDSARGVLICGSGVGVDVVANKFPRVRSACALTSNQAFDARHDDDVNVLSLGANYLKPEEAQKILLTWLETPFREEERDRRRLKKIEALEIKLLKPLTLREDDKS